MSTKMPETEQPFSDGGARFPSAVSAPQAGQSAKPKTRRGRPKLDHPKQAITLRLDHELIAYFKNKGRHWRAEMRKTLMRAMAAEKQ